MRDFGQRVREVASESKKEGETPKQEEVLQGELEESMRTVFLQGLKKELRSFIVARDPKNFKEAVEHAADLEESMKIGLSEKFCTLCSAEGHGYEECKVRNRLGGMSLQESRNNGYRGRSSYRGFRGFRHSGNFGGPSNSQFSNNF